MLEARAFTALAFPAVWGIGTARSDAYRRLGFPAPSPPPPAVTPHSPCVQDLWPNSFAGLVRIYNHKAVDCLLVKHDVEATKRDRLAAAAAAARVRAKALGCSGGSGSGAGEPSAEAAATEGGKAESHVAAGDGKAAKAAATLAAAEARLSVQQHKVAQLESDIEAARQAALKEPLGSAFIALFRCGLRVTEWQGCCNLPLQRHWLHSFHTSASALAMSLLCLVCSVCNQHGNVLGVASLSLPHAPAPCLGWLQRPDRRSHCRAGASQPGTCAQL